MLRFEVVLQKPFSDFYDEFTVENDATSSEVFAKAQKVAMDLMLECIDWYYSLGEPDEDGDCEATVFVEYPNNVFNEHSVIGGVMRNNDLLYVKAGTPKEKIEEEAEELAGEIMLSDIDWFCRLVDADADAED